MENQKPIASLLTDLDIFSVTEKTFIRLTPKNFYRANGAISEWRSNLAMISVNEISLHDIGIVKIKIKACENYIIHLRKHTSAALAIFNFGGRLLFESKSGKHHSLPPFHGNLVGFGAFGARMILEKGNEYTLCTVKVKPAYIDSYMVLQNPTSWWGLNNAFSTVFSQNRIVSQSVTYILDDLFREQDRIMSDPTLLAFVTTSIVKTFVGNVRASTSAKSFAYWRAVSYIQDFRRQLKQMIPLTSDNESLVDQSMRDWDLLRLYARRVYGFSLTELIANERFELAKSLLRHTDRSLDDIAEAAGLPSQDALFEYFKRFEQDPDDYRQQYYGFFKSSGDLNIPFRWLE